MDGSAGDATTFTSGEEAREEEDDDVPITACTADEFTTAAVVAALVVAAAVAVAGVVEKLDEVPIAAATLGIAVHRFPPMDVMEAPAGRDMVKDSRPAPQRREIVSNEWERKEEALRPSRCYHKHIQQCANMKEGVVEGERKRAKERERESRNSGQTEAGSHAGAGQ